MITKIGVLDFQSIKQLAVECGPITVFVGESDSGKSAVVRALHAAAFNDYPSDHVREGASHSVVVLATETGSVQVEKGKGKNTYALNRLHLEGQAAGRKEWDRVGRDVPEEVAEFLGWRVVELDDGTKFAPSIQRQFDGPFLLADSPVKVAKVLGSLTNISTLFAAVREGTLEERRLKRASDEALEESKRHGVARDEALVVYEAAHVAARGAVEALEAVDGLASRLEALTALHDGVARAAAAVLNAQIALGNAQADVVEVPDLDDRFQRWAQLRGLEREASARVLLVQRAEADRAAAQAVFSAAQLAFDAYVEAMDLCPICERPMEGAFS